MAGHTYLVFASIEYLFPDVNFLQSNLLVVDSDYWKMLKEWNKIKLENNQKQEAWVQGPKALLVRRRAFRFEIAGARALAPAAAARDSDLCALTWTLAAEHSTGLIPAGVARGLAIWVFRCVRVRLAGGAPGPPGTRWRLHKNVQILIDCTTFNVFVQLFAYIQ